jgi:hypothetical protein
MLACGKKAGYIPSGDMGQFGSSVMLQRLVAHKQRGPEFSF